MTLHSAKTLKDIKHNFDEFENADNDFLNDQYTHFRKRLIETYLRIDKLMGENEKKDKTKAILKTLKLLKESDANFITLTTQAINSKLIADMHVSNALIVNRAFVQSSRQILLGLREFLLSEEEIRNFETVQDLTGIEFENE
jgi:hypothetical protein